MSKDRFNKWLVTDKETDYLFHYFANEDKFNEQLRGTLDKELDDRKKIRDQINIIANPNVDQAQLPNNSSVGKEELPENHSDTVGKDKDVVFNNEKSEEHNSELSDRNSIKSPYGTKINAQLPAHPENNNYNNNYNDHDRELLADKMVGNVDKYAEIGEDRRGRARDAYSKLQDLVERYGVKLTREFTIDDDPEEMEEEFKMHKERRNKSNQVNFYWQVLFGMVAGAEFLNEKYNPFEFKLKDWSKQIAQDRDNYTEVLEEIYEKYKNRGGKTSPEIRLLFLIILSGVTFHLSKTLFGADGLSSAMQSNPNVLQNMLGGLIGGKGMGNSAEPAEAQTAPHNKDDILAKLKQFNNKKSENRSETRSDILTSDARPKKSETNNGRITGKSEMGKIDALAHEREKRLLAEQRAAMYEEQLRTQNEMHMAQLGQRNNIPVHYQLPEKIHSPNTPLINRVLSTTKPKLKDNLYSVNNPIKNMFDSEVASSDKEINRNSSIKQSFVKQPMDLIESLGGSTDSELDNILPLSDKKNNISLKPITSTKKPITTAYKPINSITRSVNRYKTENGSDARGKQKSIKL